MFFAEYYIQKKSKRLIKLLQPSCQVIKIAMLNRIVLTENNQITTLKVIDELQPGEIKTEMLAIEKSLASNNSRKVTLDLDNLQVFSSDTHELLGLIIRHVRLLNIPISITGSSQLDPGIILSISEGRPHILTQEIPKKKFTIKPKYSSRFHKPFFSSERVNPLFKGIVQETITPKQSGALKSFIKDKPEDVSFILPKDFADNDSIWFPLGWVLLSIFTITAIALSYSIWSNSYPEKIYKMFFSENKKIIVNKNFEKKGSNNKNYKVSLIMAVKSGDKNTVEDILENGANINEKDRKGYTALMHAVKNKNIELIKILAEAGAEIDVVDEFDDTPLIWATSMKSNEIVKFLLNNGADPDKGDFTALMWASFHGDLEMLNIFLESGAKINARTEEGWTSLMWAAEKGNTQVIWELLRRGAIVNMQNNSGRTALILATRKGHIGSIGLLLEKGSDPFLLDFKKKSAIDYAQDFQRFYVLQLFEKQVNIK